MSETTRPQFRNIHITDIVRYRMPLSALTSILHRVSGALIFLLLPFILYLLDKSITSEDSFAHFMGIASQWWVKLVLLALSWAYLHHFCAGLRHLVMDTHIGLDKQSARHTAASVLIVSLLLTLVVALKLFGVF
jgi:succinate dehydrogenase / fumarate reductase cytochrome b subunit